MDCSEHLKNANAWMKVVWEAHDRACLHETADWEGTLVSSLRGAYRCSIAVVN